MKEKGIPILAFLINETIPVPPGNMEKDNPEKLAAFKQEVKTGRLIEWWTTPDDLAQKLSVSLHKQMDRKKRPGWVRADSFNIEESHAEILTLNKRVRDLEAENKKLSDELQAFLRQKSERQPRLEVIIRVDTIDDELGKMCHPVFALQDENALMKGIRILRLSADRVDNRYKAITMDDFPPEIRNTARQDEIDAYNNSLPSAGEINAYKERLVNYVQITKKLCTSLH